LLVLRLGLGLVGPRTWLEIGDRHGWLVADEERCERVEIESVLGFETEK
jgi:hypothetical protein